MDDSRRPGSLIVSSRNLLLSLRRLEFLQHLLEITLGLVVFGSIAAPVLVRVPGDAGAVGGALIAGAIVLTRALVITGVRQRTGAHVVAVHGSGRWLSIRPRAGDRSLGWSIDLSRAALPRGPLLLPGVALVAATLVPAVARPWQAAAEPSAHPLLQHATLFVAALVLLHQAAAAAVAHRPAYQRFRLALPWALWALTILAFVPFVTGTRLGPALGSWRSVLAWPGVVWLPIGGWTVCAALAAVRRDPLVFGGLGALLALAVLGGLEQSPHVWTCFAVVSALTPVRPGRVIEPRPSPGRSAGETQ